MRNGRFKVQNGPAKKCALMGFNYAPAKQSGLFVCFVSFSPQGPHAFLKDDVLWQCILPRKIGFPILPRVPFLLEGGPCFGMVVLARKRKEE